jgi:hypothetical protein
MRTYLAILANVLISTIAFLGICRGSVAHAEGAATAVPSYNEGAMAGKPADATRCEKENPSPKISFESTICDLGLVGLSTKNACEFKFRNTGQATLKVANVRRTLGVPRSLPTFQAGTVHPAHAKLRHAIFKPAPTDWKSTPRIDPNPPNSILAYFSSRCGCAVAKLEKKRYVPRKVLDRFGVAG